MKNTLTLSAAAIALLITSLGAPAFGSVAPISDTLTVGLPGLGGGTQNILEGTEPATASVGVPIAEVSQDITGSETILLTEPGVPGCCNISDIVTATITGPNTNGFFQLSVQLTSDGEVPLTFLGAALSIPETGAVQDLTSDFTSAFGLNSISLPTIQLTSDVPEPSTWALMLVGFAGLGYACLRRTSAPRIA